LIDFPVHRFSGSIGFPVDRFPDLCRNRAKKILKKKTYAYGKFGQKGLIRGSEHASKLNKGDI